MTHHRVTFHPIPKPTPRPPKERKRLQSRPRLVDRSAAAATFTRDNYTCQWCLIPGGRLVPHHRLLRSHGGKDRPEHMVSAHVLCHGAIHREVEEAKRRRFIVSDAGELARGVDYPVDRRGTLDE